jgi:hypothetical protein
MGREFWWNWFVQLAIAIGTIGAVIVALFGNRFRAFLLPPRLKLSLLARISHTTECIGVANQRNRCAATIHRRFAERPDADRV